LQKTGGKSIQLMLAVALITTVVAAFFTSITAVVLLIPIIFSITARLKKSPIPYLIIIISTANIGGALTMIGDGVNILISTNNQQLTFIDFVANMAIPVFLSLVVAFIVTFLFYRKELTSTTVVSKELMAEDASKEIKNKSLAIKSLIVLLFVIVGFIICSAIGIESATIALFGAAFLMLLSCQDEHDVANVFAKVE